MSPVEYVSNHDSSSTSTFPLVSFVIPCFNHGRWLLEAIESIERNCLEYNFEIIVVDDGSTDQQTVSVLSELQGTGKYTVCHQENSGPAAARNTAIRRSRGDFFVPLDTDNRILDTYLKKGVRVLMENPKLAVVYGDAFRFGEKTGVWTFPIFDPFALCMNNCIDACALVRKSAWEDVGGFDESRRLIGWEDWELWLRLLVKGWDFHHVGEVAFEYRVRSDSLISTTSMRTGDLFDYIFSKPELRLVKLIRERYVACDIANRRLDQNEHSLEYRLGKLLVGPLRFVQHRLLTGTWPSADGRPKNHP